jgi:hypothetical protein
MLPSNAVRKFFPCVCISWANDSAIGMVATATRTILENLDRIPDEDERTKVAIICYDTSLYFFSMPVRVNFQSITFLFLLVLVQPGTSESSMLVVSDIDDVFLPKPSDLLVNLAESRQSLEALLGRINDMFQENTIIGSVLGPALQAGYKLMASPLPCRVPTLTLLVSHLLVGRSSFFLRPCQVWALVPLKTGKTLRFLAHQKFVYSAPSNRSELTFA